MNATPATPFPLLCLGHEQSKILFEPQHAGDGNVSAKHWGSTPNMQSESHAQIASLATHNLGATPKCWYDYSVYYIYIIIITNYYYYY